MTPIINNTAIITQADIINLATMNVIPKGNIVIKKIKNL